MRLVTLVVLSRYLLSMETPLVFLLDDGFSEFDEVSWVG